MKTPAIGYDAFERGVELFNQRRYFEAHDAWEDLWLAAEDPVKKRFFQGLIMAAGAFLHFKKRNCAGASALLSRSIELLDSTGSGQQKMLLDDFVASLEVLRESFKACSFNVSILDLPGIHLSEVVH